MILATLTVVSSEEQKGTAVKSQSPLTTLDARCSDENAQATPWPDALARLKKAELSRVSTVRPDSRATFHFGNHVTRAR